MNDAQRKICESIETSSGFYSDISDQIWEYAETRFEETKSAGLLCEVLKNQGFAVEIGIADIPTAFVGTYGTGEPVIGLLAEYDALSGMSQKSDINIKEPIAEGENGHGCGHHLLGTGAVAAAIAVKEYLNHSGKHGTVKVFGCPAEEGGSGKVYMVREGVFEGTDIALSWHPFAQNAVWSVSSLANYQVYFRFHGKSAHAAASPHLGRSALDAVELMNIGVNYLREHIVPEARVHYAVTNTGGNAPNVVQAEAEVLYLMRAPELSQVRDIYDRVCDIAKGAALMTQTKVEIIFDKACSNLIMNNTLSSVLYENMKRCGPVQPSEMDIAFGQEIFETFTESDIVSEENMVKMYTPVHGADAIQQQRGKKYTENILPYTGPAGVLPGSTDVGDVSWVVPTAQIISSCYALGTPGHSWQLVAQGKRRYAHNGMLMAAKVLALTAVDIIESPEIALKAKQELSDRLDKISYECPIPKAVKPSIHR